MRQCEAGCFMRETNRFFGPAHASSHGRERIGPPPPLCPSVHNLVARVSYSPVRRSCPILLAVNDTCGVTRMTSTCAARVPSLRWAPQRGWVGSWVSVRPAKCRTSGGHAVVCAAVSFRPCIDIHKGKVKQIVGSTLRDLANDSMELVTNFESDKSPAEFAKFYKADELLGGHVIMLGANPSSQAAALEALRAYPGGLQVGGGINLENAMSYLNEGASHVIVTSYVFSDGKMNTERLRKLVELVGKQRLVLDLSCRKKDGRYTIVTDRWQKFSDVFVDEPTLEYLAAFADEFLVHGVDVEGKRCSYVPCYQVRN
ncbi:1-(5-phosphoribosyl)-5-[(5-phosphoribosylamino)methylideneamino] imidazole-4-carboxamide isomerase, chloroplastic isoform X3 [Zea mays]|uniref:1-(5-phosphoribosyl)-5-[(5- phosphoribosylamino)methylideneamino] imidazole-4-carboxamide isomerase, chloroplastic isoform X3 n=1 Tax=Zea mays TaxID=4577 RepID=UPI0004DEA5AA|nr:uncharacterized protein LOC100284229 isoform X3 [Zea mays]